CSTRLLRHGLLPAMDSQVPRHRFPRRVRATESSGLWITRTTARSSHRDVAQRFYMPMMRRISQVNSGTVLWGAETRRVMQSSLLSPPLLTARSTLGPAETIPVELLAQPVSQ